MTQASSDIPFPRFVGRRTFYKGLAKVVLALLTRLEVEGQENIPEEGPLLLVSNHFHFADPVVILATMPGLIEFIADDVAPNAPSYLGWIRRLWGFIMIHRGAASHDGLRKAVRLLRRQAGMVYISPEAGSWAAVLRPARPGVAFIASQSQAPILPIGLEGMNDIFPSLARGRRARVTIRYGRPFGPLEAKGRGRERRERLDAIGDEIMEHIKPLIPPAQHGVYSDDPALREAAAEAAVYPWDESQG